MTPERKEKLLQGLQASINEANLLAQCLCIARQMVLRDERENSIDHILDCADRAAEGLVRDSHASWESSE